MAGGSPEGFTMFRGHWYRDFTARVIEVEYPLSSIDRAHKDEWPSLRNDQGEPQLGAVEFAAWKFISDRTELKHFRAIRNYLENIFLEGMSEAGVREKAEKGPNRPEGFEDHYGRNLYYINQDGTVLVRQIVNHLDRITENFEKIPGTDPEATGDLRIQTDDLIEEFESLHQDGLEYATSPEVVDIDPGYQYLPLDHEDTVEGAEDIKLYFEV